MTSPSLTSWQLFPLGTLGMMQRCGRSTPTWGDQSFCRCLTIWKAFFALTPASFLASSWQVTSWHWSIQFVISYFHHLTIPALAWMGQKWGCEWLLRPKSLNVFGLICLGAANWVWTCSKQFGKNTNDFKPVHNHFANFQKEYWNFAKRFLQNFQTILKICQVVLQIFKRVLEACKILFANFMKICKKKSGKKSRRSGKKSRRSGKKCRGSIFKICQSNFLERFRPVGNHFGEHLGEILGIVAIPCSDHKRLIFGIFWEFMMLQSTSNPLWVFKLDTHQGMLERVTPLTYHSQVEWVNAIFLGNHFLSLGWFTMYRNSLDKMTSRISKQLNETEMMGVIVVANMELLHS